MNAEQHVAALEAAVQALARAAKAHDVAGLDAPARQLQAALQAAAQPLQHAARQGLLTPPLRQRLRHIRAAAACRGDALHRDGLALARVLEPLRGPVPVPAAAAAGAFAAHPARNPYGG